MRVCEYIRQGLPDYFGSKQRRAQTCLQPIFAKSDEKFARNEMLHSACENERGVKYTKTSWIIKRGIPNGNFSLVLLEDIWLAWGFQVNFMYDPVH